MNRPQLPCDWVEIARKIYVPGPMFPVGRDDYGAVVEKAEASLLVGDILYVHKFTGMFLHEDDCYSEEVEARAASTNELMLRMIWQNFPDFPSHLTHDYLKQESP